MKLINYSNPLIRQIFAILVVFCLMPVSAFSISTAKNTISTILPDVEKMTSEYDSFEITLAETSFSDSVYTDSRADTLADTTQVSIDVIEEARQERFTMRWYIENFQADMGALTRRYAVNPSDEYFERFTDFYLDWLQKLNDIMYDDLSLSEKVDYHLLRNKIEQLRHEMMSDFALYNSITHMLPDPQAMIELVQIRRRGEKLHAPGVAAKFNSWTHQMEKLQSDATSDRMLTRPQALMARRALETLHRAVKDVYDFYYGYDPDFTWWMERPFEELDKKFGEYAQFIGTFFDSDALSMDESGIVGNPIGRDAIIKSLEFEMIAYTPEELIARAEIEFAWSEQQMLKASRELGYGDDWKAALEHVKKLYVDPGRQPELVQYLAEEAVEFLEARDLITIPDLAKETWRMTMLSPEMQRIAPFFLGGEVVRIAYPTNTMDHELAMMSLRGNNPHFSRAVVHHELIPGHHLQQFMNQRYNTQRRMFRTPFWGEGWALYWEKVLWDKDFALSPEDRIGMLYWRMHRCARIVFSLSYHMNQMTPQQAIDYLVDKVGHERANAEAEVRRSFEGNYGPLYQIAYMVGAMQLYALRADLVDTGLYTEKEFHDFILKQNSIPIALVRALLTGEELPRDFVSDWRF